MLKSQTSRPRYSRSPSDVPSPEIRSFRPRRSSLPLSLTVFDLARQVVKTVFSSTGKWLATASYDRTIKLYSLVPPAPRLPSVLDDPEELDEDPLGKDVEDRWELRKVVETKSNPEGLVFSPTEGEGGEEAWLAFTTRCIPASYASLRSSRAESLCLPPFFSQRGPPPQIHPPPLDAQTFRLRRRRDRGALRDPPLQPQPERGRPSLVLGPVRSFSSLSLFPTTNLPTASLTLPALPASLASALALHPSGKHLALLTGNHASGNLSRIFLYPFLDGERKLTLWTGACAFPSPVSSFLLLSRSLTRGSWVFFRAACDQFSSPRMAWFPDGSAVAVTSDDGVVRVVDLQGRYVSLPALFPFYPSLPFPSLPTH